MKKLKRMLKALLPKRTHSHCALDPVEVIMRHSRGNVNLQLGNVMQDDEYCALRGRATSYVFT